MNKKKDSPINDILHVRLRLREETNILICEKAEYTQRIWVYLFFIFIPLFIFQVILVSTCLSQKIDIYYEAQEILFICKI